MRRSIEKRLSSAWLGGYGHRSERKAKNKPYRRRIKEQLRKQLDWDTPIGEA